MTLLESITPRLMVLKWYWVPRNSTLSTSMGGTRINIWSRKVKKRAAAAVMIKATIWLPVKLLAKIPRAP